MHSIEMRICTYTHGKGTTEVIENDPRTGIAGVIHLLLLWGETDRDSDDKQRDEMAAGVMLRRL
jgi:hypothetical protein